jgi:hypothetical protein
MKAVIKPSKSGFLLENDWLQASLSLDSGLRLESFIDRANGSNLGNQPEHRLVLDRQLLDLAAPGTVSVLANELCSIDDAYQRPGQMLTVTSSIAVPGGEITWKRHFHLYDEAPALRIFDTFSATCPLSGLYNSDLLSFVPAFQGKGTCVNYFSCTDQSNHRVLEQAPAPKNQGCFFLYKQNDTGLFFYKEGPNPDSQPIKGEYDFLCDGDRLSVTGLGFDKIAPGEHRRANGVVIGLLEEADSLLGIKRYQRARYKVTPGTDIEFLANSWPAFGLDVTEAKMLAELEVAHRAGVQCLFIDDGWFDTFMGEICPEKFPNGFRLLCDRARDYGINIGLWMNPMGLDSRNPKAAEWDGAERHDTITEGNSWNWMARSNDFRPVELISSEGVRTYYTMDLLNPGYFKHIRDKILGLHREYGIKRFKFDLYQLNVLDTLLGDPNLHYEAYRNLLCTLKQAIPELIISMDVTRRNRPGFDFAQDFGRLFMENRGRNIPDHRYYHPHMALKNLWDAARYIHPQKLEIEIMPQIDDYPLEYILSTGLFANPLYWGSLCELSEDKIERMREFNHSLGEHRQRIAEGLIFPVGDAPAPGSWSGFVSLAANTAEKSFYLAIYKNGDGQNARTFEIPALASFCGSMRDIFAANQSLEFSHGRCEVRMAEPCGFRLYQLQATS